MKKINKFLILAFAIFILLLPSCSGGFYPILFGEDSVDERTKNHYVLEGEDLPTSAIPAALETYSFVVFTDIHVGAKVKDHYDNFLQWFEKQFDCGDETLIPRFAVCLGDDANDGYESQYKDYVKFTNKMKNIANNKLSITDYKVYSSIGNHDLFHNGYEKWKEYVYPYHTYYSFKTKGFSYYVLDTANGTLGVKQLEDFEERLEEDKNYKIILTHYPIYSKGMIILTTQDDLFITRILTASAKNNVKYIFEGHTHRKADKDFKIFKESVTASFLYDRVARLVTVNSTTGEISTQMIEF